MSSNSSNSSGTQSETQSGSQSGSQSVPVKKSNKGLIAGVLIFLAIVIFLVIYFGVGKCNPACIKGNCKDGKCVCSQGFSGNDCNTPTRSVEDGVGGTGTSGTGTSGSGTSGSGTSGSGTSGTGTSGTGTSGISETLKKELEEIIIKSDKEIKYYLDEIIKLDDSIENYNKLIESLNKYNKKDIPNEAVYYAIVTAPLAVYTAVVQSLKEAQKSFTKRIEDAKERSKIAREKLK